MTTAIQTIQALQGERRWGVHLSVFSDVYFKSVNVRNIPLPNVMPQVYFPLLLRDVPR